MGNLYIKKTEALFFIILILYISFFGMSRDLIPFVSIISLLVGFVHVRFIGATHSNYSAFIIVFALSSLASSLRVCALYHQTLIDALLGIHFIFIYFLFYWLKKQIEEDQISVSWIIDCIINVGIISTFIYRFLHSNILTLGGLFYFAFMFSFCRLVCNINLQNIIKTIILLYTVIFYVDSRGMILGVFISILCTVIFAKYQDKSWKVLVALCIFAVAIQVMMKGGFFDQYFGSAIDEMTNLHGSGAARVYELEYYSTELFKSIGNTVLGIGIAYGRSPAHEILYRGWNYFFIEDTGSLGVIFKQGLVGAISILLFLRGLFKTYRVKKENQMIACMSVYLFSSIVSTFWYRDFFSMKTWVFFLMIYMAITDSKNEEIY